MKTSGFLLLLFALFFITACEKENPASSPEIKTGDYNNLIINFYDTTLAGGYHNPQTFNLDLDNNGIDDIQFMSEVWGSLGMGQIPRSEIRCLHSGVKLLGIKTFDTLFLNRDTIVQEGQYPHTWEMYLINNYTCQLIDEADTILSVNPDFDLLILKRGEIISKSQDFNADTITLASGPNNPYPMPGGSIGDTIIYNYNISLNNCDPFPLQTVSYVGVFMDNERLGWIKISIFDWYKILIHESGLQTAGLIE